MVDDHMGDKEYREDKATGAQVSLAVLTPCGTGVAARAASQLGSSGPKEV